MSLDALIKAIKAFIEEVAPALAVMLWNYTQTEEEESKNEARKVKTQLQLNLNHEQVDKANDGKSDLDILNDAVGNGQSNGAGQLGSGNSGSEQFGTGTNSGSSDKKSS